MRRVRWSSLLLALGLVAAACGDDSDGDSAATTTAASDDGGQTTTTEDDLFGDDGGTDTGGDDGESGEDPCEGVTLEATDTGITADTITVLVMADVGSELAPGLFQGSIDGVKAWAQKVNDSGGLACRQVEVIEFDSALNPVETTNGLLEACDRAAALIGSTALFITDVSPIEDCGIADIPERATAPIHSCSPNVFTVGGRAGSCPYSGSGPRDYKTQVGPYRWILENEHGGGPVKGAYIIPSDLPTTIAATMPTIRAVNELGVDTAGGEFGASGSAEQATYGQYIQFMRDNGVTWAQNGSNDQAMLKWRKEAVAQGFDDTGVSWICSLACYTPDFIDQGGADVEGTWIWMQFLPFNETDTNEELASFIEYIGDPQPSSWSAGAWASGVLFEQVINDIVEAEGPNGITRQAILDGLGATTEFDANGWYGTLDMSTGDLSQCFVIMQVQNGEWVRVHPEEPGTFDCDPSSLLEQKGLDAAAEFGG